MIALDAVMMEVGAIVDHVMALEDENWDGLLRRLRPDVVIMRRGSAMIEDIDARQILETFAGRLCVIGESDGRERKKTCETRAARNV